MKKEKITLEKKYIDEIRLILNKYLSGEKYKKFIFGSRVNGNSKRYSDIDIGIISDQKLPLDIYSKIFNDLDDSNVPYKMDLVDFNRGSKGFQNIAMRNIYSL